MVDIVVRVTKPKGWVGKVVRLRRANGGDDEKDENMAFTIVDFSNWDFVNLSNCNDSTREIAFRSMPPMPPAPASYTLAAREFTHELLSSADIPDETSSGSSSSSDVIFYFRYIRNCLQTLLLLRQKFSYFHWYYRINKFWYETNLWPDFIDYLLSRSPTLCLLRQAPIITGQSRRDRYDGVFRCTEKGFKFDLGVIRLCDPFRSDMKAKADRKKIMRTMQRLLRSARERVENEEKALQVVGILWTGWLVDLFCMSYDAKFKYIIHRQNFSCQPALGFHLNLEFMEALVRHVEIMEQTAAVIVAKGDDVYVDT